MPNSLIRICCSKWVALKRHWEYREARRFTKIHTPELIVAYAAFSNSMQSGSPRQPYKGRDLWRILEQVRPQNIVELGSGTTSAVFALWAERYSASYAAFEHHPHWAKVTQSALNKAGVLKKKAPIRVVNSRVREDQGATGFVEKLPLGSDFIYVDGPPCKLDSGRKVPNDDVVRFFDAGGKPKAIVIDGRLETVDLIASHPTAKDYRIQRSFVYCLRRGLWKEAMSGREHTLFLRKAL